jgi:hypothetical protein
MEFAAFGLGPRDTFFEEYWKTFNLLKNDGQNQNSGEEDGPPGWRKRRHIYDWYHYGALLVVRKNDFCMKKCESALRGKGAQPLALLFCSSFASSLALLCPATAPDLPLLCP